MAKSSEKVPAKTGQGRAGVLESMWPPLGTLHSEIDRLFEAGKDAVKAFQIREFTVRDGNAAAHSGGAQALTLHQHVEDFSFVDAGDDRRATCKFLQRLLFAGRTEIGNDAVGIEQIS